jgi:dihydrofolate reductase
VRRLNKREVIIISRILEDVNFKHYAEYLLTNKIDKVLKQDGDRKSKMIVIMGDIAAFIIQNLYKADENIDRLIVSYYQIKQNECNELDVDTYIEYVKTIFMAGVPSVIKDFVDVNELKKKMQELKKS